MRDDLGDHEQEERLRRQRHLFQRTVGEIGGAALYLLSEMSGGVTGEIHFVDAGYSVVDLALVAAGEPDQGAAEDRERRIETGGQEGGSLALPKPRCGSGTTLARNQRAASGRASGVVRNTVTSTPPPVCTVGR